MLIRRLLSQAYLFDDPAAYEAGVRDTLAVLAEQGGEGGAVALVDAMGVDVARVARESVAV